MTRSPRFSGAGALAFVSSLVLLFVLALGLASPSLAQYSNDPAANLAVADAAGDQVQPKVAPTSDGGAWISWFDSIGNGYDVRVQRLDAIGNETLPHAGVLVADRGFSSTQDYGLDVDASDRALLVFRDDRGSGVQITAARVSAAGSLDWGAGITLTATSDFVAAPKIAGTSDGGAFVAWTQNADVHVRKLDTLGAPQWGSDVVLTPLAGSYSVSDMHDAGTDAVLAFVHQTGSFGSPRHLLAQKFDSAGALLWGAAHVAVFDGGSLQFGNFPEFVPDGSGGGVFSWYDTAGAQLQSYAQRILANGTEAFAHNGVAVSTDATRIRVSPWATFDAATSETFVFFKEQSSTQSMAGVYGQKLSAAGVRQWGSTGKVVVPLGSSDITLVRDLPSGGGAFVYWSAAPSFGQDRLYGAHLDTNGTIDITTFDVASTPSVKSRLDVEASSTGVSILAWSDQRSDGGDIYAQNVNADGSLGPVFVDDAPLVAGAGAAPTLGRPWPNPTRGATRVWYASSVGARLDVLDVRGRVVRTLASELSASPGAARWDGLDAHGQPAAAGVYLIRMTTPASTASRKVTLIR